jgi:hypothetical protein
VPSWQWHATSSGVPPPLLGKTRTLARELFSARWTTRISVDKSDTFTFSSYANKGSRIVVNDATILDEWHECCSTYTSEPLQLDAGYHIVAYEYRSGYTTDYSPINSFAQLSWSVAGETFGTVSGSNSTNVTSTADELYADVGWLACSAGHGTIHGNIFEAGLIAGDVNLATTIRFASAFTNPPRVFGAVISKSDLSSHLRLSETVADQATVAIEYDACDAVFVSVDTAVGWIALAAVGGQSVRVSQRQTLATDTAALHAIGTALQLPEYFHWRNMSDPCGDRWTGIECRTDASGTPRIVVLDIHNVDLTNQDVPWSFIGQLTGLEEISMYNCGLTGIIDGEFLCRLTLLQVLALRQNKLRGTVPECMATLPLEWLWLEDNNFHGPLPELSPLGQFLKAIPNLSLRRNRWTPLLASEKQALEELSEPLGVLTHPHEHDWDFAYSYEWAWASATAEDGLTAAREVSYRQWNVGVPVTPLLVDLDVEFPRQGRTTAKVAIGADGAWVMVGDMVKTPGGGVGHGSYDGIDQPLSLMQARDFCKRKYFDLASIHSEEDKQAVLKACMGHSCWIGLNDISVEAGGNGALFVWFDESLTDFPLSWLPGEPNNWGSGQDGVEIQLSGTLNDKGEVSPRAFVCETTFPGLATAASSASDDSTCWFSLPALVPSPHTISEASTDRSSQGEAYFTEHFCPSWSTFIFASCDPDEEVCDGGIARAGNAIIDGGDDMYDIGNLIMTSLMADCDTSNDVHDCPLGSLVYQSDFERVPTNCFGSGGHYQMQQLDGMWVFFTTNTNGSPIDFMITGNLGSDDDSGSVTEYFFDAVPHTGFVKRECGDTDDPSVNHMIIVDSSQGRPTHTCGGGDCTGSSSGSDDDMIAGIAPDSPILYLLYSTAGGSCMKEDEHRAIFDVAALCILAADPFSALNRRQTAASQLLVEIDVDDAHHILFGGRAP